MADDGCQTQGCNLTDKDIGKMRYAELWNQYRACEQGKGGCSNPIEALVFTTIGLIGVGLLSEAPAAVGWVLDNLGIGAATTAATTASTAACADGNCTNEAQSALNLLQQLTASGGRVPVPTGQISANVMAQLQEATGLEHALIRAADGARYLLQLGGKAVDGITLAGGNLPADTVRLIAHTHPGQGLMSLIPSNFDNMVLLKLEQTFSLIINQAGEVLRWRPIPYD
jgi:hypothetical protein